VFNGSRFVSMAVMIVQPDENGTKKEINGVLEYLSDV